MIQEIHDPLSEYVNVFRERFSSIALKTFDDLSAEANVDVDANRKTCRAIYAAQQEMSGIESRISNWTLVRVVFWILFGFGLLLFGLTVYHVVSRAYPYEESDFSLIFLGGSAVLLILNLTLINPRIKALKKPADELQKKIDVKIEEAWEQMKPLNELYDWDILARMMSATVPKLEFDPYFTTQRLADLKAVYDWDGSFNEGRSVLFSHSGLINGNPFVLCRTRKMEMGVKVYHGHKAISWTESHRNSDGTYSTVTRRQVLRASYTAPCPYYFEKTRLIYANTAAPDLVFHRKQSDLAGTENTFSYKRKRRKLRRKARKLDNTDFAMMTNEDFEVSFDTSDRNDNHQFALLFTPLAQQSMLDLLRDREHGYGDDFDFIKNRMINMIVSDHMQMFDIDLDPHGYMNFDFDKAKADFVTVNSRYFRAIYFAFAPLLCVPMYQQIRPQHDIYGRDMKRESSFWEHEALANFWGQDNFRHPECATDCILKTSQSKGEEDESSITVYAYGFRATDRLTYVSRYGGDGHYHDVPVHWVEYTPVTGLGSIHMKEDNEPEGEHVTQKERICRINRVLGASGMKLYRRHIASRVSV